MLHFSSSLTKCAFTAIILATSSVTTFAQSSILKGKVKDGEGKTLANINVLIKSLNNGTTTDADGQFHFSGLPKGNYSITFSGIGFTRKVVEVSIPASNLSIILEQGNYQLDEVTVEGKTVSQEVRETSFNVTAIETKQFANTATDLNQVLNRTTGVRVREEGGLGSSFNFAINGLSGKAVKFFIDGVPMETFGNSLSLNNIPTNLVDRMEVYKGVVPVTLGSDALGGAVNIVTTDKITHFLDASYSYGSFNTHRAALSGQYKFDSIGLIIKANAFYNSSDNNYVMRDVEVIENNQFVKKDLRRFHDKYSSSMFQLESGFVNRKWADAFLLGILYSSQDKQLQTGSNQETVLGGVTTSSDYVMPTFKYKKENLFVKGLSANLFATYATDKTLVQDTSSFTYGWDGQVITSGNTNGEINYIKSLYHYDNKFTMVRSNFGYEINPTHSFNLNVVANTASRKGYNSLNENDPTNVFNKPNTLGKNIIGLGYQLNLFEQRLTTNVSAKYYHFSALARKSVYYDAQTGTITIESNRKYDFFGYGLATRYKITDEIGLKGSFEHTYRLPEPDEIFGDGRFVVSNIDLMPEQSNNVNLGAYFTNQVNKHSFAIEASWFYRNVKDFIYFIPGVKFAGYLNAGSVLINGYEGEIRYGYNNLLAASVNVSYQNAINNSQYVLNTLQKDVTYKDRIPNQPYLFGNAEFGIGKNNLLGKDTRIQFTLFTQFIEEFYLTWPSLGSKNSKNVIPQQLIHNASLTYSLANGKYNISVESRNLTNELAYDNFKLQKPGRSFFVKLRYFIK